MSKKKFLSMLGIGLFAVPFLAKDVLADWIFRNETNEYTLNDLVNVPGGSVSRVIKVTLYNPELDSAIIVGTTSYYRVPFNCTITGWYITETSATPVSGSIVLDVWKDTSGNYPPTVADSIAGTEKPTLTTQIQNSDTTLTTWTTSLNSGDYLGIKVDSNTGCKRVELQIEVTT